MHEAGIAVAIAAEIRTRRLDPRRVRLVVSGGHGDEVAFDAALRAHLGGVAPDLGLDTMPIEHAPVPRICARCALPFEAPLAADPCPACGGPGVGVPRPERVELEWITELADGEGAPAGDTTGAVAVREAPHGPHEHGDGTVAAGPSDDVPDGGPSDDRRPSTLGPHGERLRA